MSTFLAVSNVLTCAALLPFLGVYEKSSSSALVTSVAESRRTASVSADHDHLEGLDVSEMIYGVVRQRFHRRADENRGFAGKVDAIEIEG